MDKQEILTILNSLDVQVSMGRIDQPTYEALKQKWTQQLEALEQDLGDTDPRIPIVASSSTSAEPSSQLPALEALVCPKCGAPVDLPTDLQDLSQPLRCPFCDTLYTLRQGQDNAQQLKRDLLAWFDRVVVGSGYNGSTVDVNARRYIFTESLYPVLKKEIDRRLEAFEDVLESPLIQLRETTRFREFQADRRLLVLAQGDNQWLKLLASRVSAEQLQDFAVVAADQRKLQLLQFRVQSLIHYANIAQQLTLSQRNAYQIALQNLQALQKSYEAVLQESEDERYRAFIVAQVERASGAMIVLEALLTAFNEERSLVPESAVGQVSRGLTQLDKALHLAETCGYNPLYTVALQHGIKKDLLVTRIFQTSITSYEVVTRTQPGEFPAFYRSLLHYIDELTEIQNAEHLLWLLTSISRVLQARAGSAPLPVLKQWNWLDGAVERQRRTGTLGFGGESSEVRLRFYQPYWAARLRYTAVDGKRTNERYGLMLVDATRTQLPQAFALLNEDSVLPQIADSTQRADLLDKQVLSLPALVTHALAEHAMKIYAEQHISELKVLTIQMIGIVYLPVAVVRYSAKQKHRDLVIGQVRSVNQDLNTALLQTQEFLGTYMA